MDRTLFLRRLLRRMVLIGLVAAAGYLVLPGMSSDSADAAEPSGDEPAAVEAEGEPGVVPGEATPEPETAPGPSAPSTTTPTSPGAPSAEELPDAVAEPTYWERMQTGTADGLDWFIAIAGLGLILAFLYIVYSYARGLKGSPRELYLLFFTKVTEYSAYGAAQMAFVLYLHNDVGLSDMFAGSYVGGWSVGLTALTMLVGAVCDAIGIKKTLLIGAFALLFARFFMPLLDDIWLVSILGFAPLAVGIAITGPVLSVGIKKFTTREGAALGFALFYTMMNVGWAIGGWIFDFVRGIYGDKQVHDLPIVGWEISTYQIIMAVGFFLTLPDLVAILLMRDNVEMTEDGIAFSEKKVAVSGVSALQAMKDAVKEAGVGTVQKLKNVFTEKAFWIFIGLIGVLVFVRLTFYHFHFTFPTYGIRVFGEGVKVGNIFGVLNPVLIVFLVPLFGALTKRVRSYKMLLIGTIISAGSVFIATLPESVFQPLMGTAFAELIFDRWLDVPVPERIPYYLSLVVFISTFTIGEALWSPRLMQFTAEIAPKGKEGSYIALSYLPYFGGKFLAGPMSGWLISTYVPEGGAPYDNHWMVWMWIGLMASLSPAGLLILRRLYHIAEEGSAAALAGGSDEPDDDDEPEKDAA
ncbi:MAG: MFS transporter [Myxococcota bacterium]